MLDLRLQSADVVTMDPQRPAARSIGIWNGYVVGLDEEIDALPARRVVDLDGACVLPGFIDAHVHLAWTGLRARTPSIAPCRELDAVLAVIGRAALARPEGEWVDVVGYDQRSLGRHLTAGDLDRVSAGRKILLLHDSGHACVVNTAVLDLLPDGVRHDDGLLTEGAMAVARQLRLPYPLTDLADVISAAGRTCLSEGVTACAEAGIGGGLICHSPVELAAYLEAMESGRLPLRVQLMVAAAALHPVGAHAGDRIGSGADLGLRTGLGGNRLTIGALKVFADGGMMPRTAALTRPYVGLDHGGDLFADPAELIETIVAGHVAGWQVAVHAIGDLAVDVALDALAKAQRVRPRPDARHRIEHAGLVRPDQLPRFAEAGAAAVVQPTFLWSFGDDYAGIMGPERAPWLYRGRGFLDHGVPLVGSSDRPVTDGAPLRAIQVMVERLSSAGAAIGAGEAITVDEALRAYTVEAARACHWDDLLGCLAPRRFADLAVLADNPRRVAPSRIAEIDVLGTAVAGTVVHGAPGWQGW
jgi:predicted amidohydrolase YtcJ